jgi:hypothetical protein
MFGLLGAAWAGSPCSIEGRLTLPVQPTAGEGFDVRGTYRATFEGSRATVEGVAPFAFRVSLGAEEVPLQVRAPVVLDRVLAVGPGTEVRVLSAAGDTAQVRVIFGGIRAVGSVPCAALGTSAPPAAPPELPLAEVAGYHAFESEQYVCEEAGGAVGCESVGRCRAFGDASVCGFRALAPRVKVFAEPDPRADALEVEVAQDDVVFFDDDARGGWLRVRAQDFRSPMRPQTYALRGWVRATDVAWRQEMPPALGVAGGLQHVAFLAVRDGRSGFVRLSPGASVVDERGRPWATATADACVPALEVGPAGRVQLELREVGGATGESRAYVDAAAAAWVGACPSETSGW